jgi:putative membrane protein
VTSGKVKATLPTAMTDKQQSTLNDLKALQGNDFTKQYHSDQVDAHKDAVDLFKRYSEGGEQADLKAWAGTTLPHLQHHLDMANGLNK